MGFRGLRGFLLKRARPAAPRVQNPLGRSSSALALGVSDLGCRPSGRFCRCPGPGQLCPSSLSFLPLAPRRRRHACFWWASLGSCRNPLLRDRPTLMLLGMCLSRLRRARERSSILKNKKVKFSRRRRGEEGVKVAGGAGSFPIVINWLGVGKAPRAKKATSLAPRASARHRPGGPSRVSPICRHLGDPSHREFRFHF